MFPVTDIDLGMPQWGKHIPLLIINPCEGPSDVNVTKAILTTLLGTKPSGTSESFSSDFRGCCTPPRLTS